MVIMFHIHVKLTRRSKVGNILLALQLIAQLKDIILAAIEVAKVFTPDDVDAKLNLIRDAIGHAIEDTPDLNPKSEVVEKALSIVKTFIK